MLSKEKIDRINYLANKSKQEGLTKEEKEEQNELRQAYLKNLRKSFKSQLTSMKVVDPLGNDVTPQKVKDEKERKKKH
ncbi:Uncharacterized protein YnzC, UPF0291/DUF896 family [Salinibacillus kushneri]|uniref:UPF0291 protein SAMN05421676_104259 n=1 Tax=Salinibacillus kushneri TaxID=237682 RepID=A0A1I0E1D6_9BACI|nr:DUF896 domain-containing protein [Salinibacillus kushneri]SET38751.1 Uncharacterized protein YnzC, UPF0291/DUF896 family [Salinibacillus kushneri]